MFERRKYGIGYRPNSLSGWIVVLAVIVVIYLLVASSTLGPAARAPPLPGVTTVAI